MPSGGARARSGPPPDPNALRRDRKDDREWLTLPPTGLEKPPAWPLTDMTDREATFWQRLWTERPQAHEWLRLGLDIEVALYCRKLSEAEKPKSSTILAQTIRQLSDSLGLSIGGMQKNRWRIPAEQSAPEPAARESAKRRGPSSRDRLKVVPPPRGE